MELHSCNCDIDRALPSATSREYSRAKLVEIRLVWQLISSLDMIIELVFHNSDQIEGCYL